MTHTLVALPGDLFGDISLRAKEIAIMNGITVEFEFNGILCRVNDGTNLDGLYRDYLNANCMGWKQIGPDCLPEYEPGVQAELDKRNKLAEEKERAWQKEYEAKCNAKRKAVEEKTEGVEIELSDVGGYDAYKAKNKDPYGAAIFEYSESWAKLMQVEMAKGKALSECAESTSRELSYLGISGCMYGCCVDILAKHWKYGESLRRWHNLKYDYDGDGVVNPAIITIS